MVKFLTFVSSVIRQDRNTIKMTKEPLLDINTPVKVLNEINKNALMESLGIEYVEVGEGFVKGSMPVDHRTVQPVGILHGGASLAFAETLGGLGSALMVDIQQFHVVGAQMSANHVGMATSGKVYGEARIVHQGQKTHVWNIDIKNEEGKLVSSARLTNMIIPAR